MMSLGAKPTFHAESARELSITLKARIGISERLGGFGSDGSAPDFRSTSSHHRHLAVFFGSRSHGRNPI